MSLYDEVMSDTVGVLWRATGGAIGGSTDPVDPWTTKILADQHAQDILNATRGTAGTPQADVGPQNDAEQKIYDQAYQDSLGDTDSANQAANERPRCDLISIVKGDNTVSSCYPWLPWVAGGLGILVVLYILGPYVGLLEKR